MKILGVDFGTKRIGLALSDDGGSLAFPESIISNDKSTIEELRKLIEKYSIKEIVVGLPTIDKEEDTTATEGAKNFAKKMEEEFGLPVHMMDERFSSHNIFTDKVGKESLHARKQKMVKPVDIDAQAAALILQRYLDSRKLRQ